MIAESIDDFHDGPNITFETDKGVKFTDKTYAIIFGSAIVLLNCVLPLPILAALCAGLKLPFAFAVPVAAIVFLAGLYCCKRLICAKLRFCVTFTPRSLQIGRGLARCDFNYEDVELIAFSHGNRGGCLRLERGGYLRLKCGRNAVRVFLPMQSLLKCADLVRQCCRNAVLVDFLGKERLPENPTRPEKSLATLEKFYRKKCLFFLFVALCLAGLFLWCMWELAQWWQGNVNAGVFRTAQLLRMTIASPLLLFLCPASVISSAKAWRTANEIRDKRRRFLEECGLSRDQIGNQPIE
jgi:hypothetical protein